MKKKFFLFFLLQTLLCQQLNSAPLRTEGFRIQYGGMVDLPDGSYVQGSSNVGGLQPDYQINLQEPELKAFLERVKQVVESSQEISASVSQGMRDYAFDETIRTVRKLVQSALPEREYDAPPYLQVLSNHREQGMNIGLGSYLQCQAGVCRENALLMHFALKAAGIPNKFFYVKVDLISHREDHAIVVVELPNGRWIVDSFNDTFHGMNLDEIMKTEGQARTARPRVASFSESPPTTARIVRINSYPIFWIPEAPAKIKCETLFN